MKKSRATPITKRLAEQFGGVWTYSNFRWDCDDGRWAARTCSCWDADVCRCSGQIWIYSEDDTPERLE